MAGHLYGGTFDELTDTCRTAMGEIVSGQNGHPRRFALFGSITRTIQPFLDSDISEHLPHLAALHRST